MAPESIRPQVISGHKCLADADAEKPDPWHRPKQQQQQQQHQELQDVDLRRPTLPPRYNSSNQQQAREQARPFNVEASGRQQINRYGACGGGSEEKKVVEQSERPRALSDYFIRSKGDHLQAADNKRRPGPPSPPGESSSTTDGGDLLEKKTRLERMAKYVPGLGIIMSLCASLFLGTAGMLVKLTTSVHGIEVAVLRAAIQLIIYSAIIRARGIRWLPKRDELYPVFTRASLGGLSITLSYSALKLIPLGDATTIRFSLPIWTLIMSYFFLRESCSSFKIFAVIISISGVVLVTKPDMCVMLVHRLLNFLCLESSEELSMHERAYEQARNEELAFLLEAPLSGDDTALASSSMSTKMQLLTDGNQTQLEPLVVATGNPQPLTYSTDTVRQFEGCLMALGSSICLSISIIALRMCKKTPSEISIFWLSALSIIIGTLTLIVMGEWSIPSNLRDCLYILLNGVCGTLGQWFMTNALKVEQSGVIALARTFDIEVAFLYSALLLGEPVRMTSIIGSVLVSLGVVSVVVPKWLGCGGNDTAEHEHEEEEEFSEGQSHADDTRSSYSSSSNHSTTVASAGANRLAA